MSSQDEVDQILKHICDRFHPSIEELFGYVFSFLRRKSDFFHLKTDPNEAKGFPAGAAERILLEQFNQQWKIKHEEDELERQTRIIKEVTSEKEKQSDPSTPRVSSEDPISIDTRGGGKTERYFWTQNHSQVELEVPLDEPVLRADISVKFGKNWVTLDVNKQRHKFFAEETLWPIVPNDCFWQLEKTEQKPNKPRKFAVVITLVKDGREVRDRMWSHVFTTDMASSIDTSKLPIRKNMDELPPDERAAAYRAMEDHHRKMKGLPSIADTEATEALHKAWDAPGSPFAGQPFDPSRIFHANK